MAKNKQTYNKNYLLIVVTLVAFVSLIISIVTLTKTNSSSEGDALAGEAFKTDFKNDRDPILKGNTGIKNFKEKVNEELGTPDLVVECPKKFVLGGYDYPSEASNLIFAEEFQDLLDLGFTYQPGSTYTHSFHLDYSSLSDSGDIECSYIRFYPSYFSLSENKNVDTIDFRNIFSSPEDIGMSTCINGLGEHVFYCYK